MLAHIARTFRRAVAILGLGLFAAHAFAAEVASWQNVLREQMTYDYDCEIRELTNVEVRFVDGEQIVAAKVHCVDSRIYNASRLDEYDEFEVKPCENSAAGC